MCKLIFQIFLDKNGNVNKYVAKHISIYSELWLDDKYKQRSTNKPDTNDPIWNESFSFNVENTAKADKLYFKVLDKGLVGKDKIGDAKFDLSKVYGGE